MMRTTRAIIILCGLFLTPTASSAQTQDSVPAPTETAGRFQLVTQNEGTMFLVDSATGRVWRYTQVVFEQEVQAREATERRAAREAERRAAQEAAEAERRRAPELAFEQRVARLMLDRDEERRRRGELITTAQRDELRRGIRADLLAADPTLLTPALEPAPEPPPEPEPESEPPPNPCTGLVACFVEVDRLRLIPTGWVSEVVQNQ